MPEAAPPDTPLIAAEALADLLQAPSPAADVLVLDCRFVLANPDAGEAAYQTGHIPGAVYAHLDHDLSGPRRPLPAPPGGPGGPGAFDGGRHPLPSPEAFQATVQRWGLSPHTQVVAYDDAGGMFAARAWWLLQWAGHARVQVLDGGWAAWQAMGGPASQAPPSRQASALVIQAHPEWVVDTQAVLAQVQHASGAVAAPDRLQLIDARAPDRFRGENETLDPVGGHIPGALNRFFQLNLGPDGRFKPPAQLHDEFTALLDGRVPAQVVHQCGSGVTACHNLLAMAHAGLPGSRLYAGSWSAWCADPDRPVAR